MCLLELISSELWFAQWPPYLGIPGTYKTRVTTHPLRTLWSVLNANHVNLYAMNSCLMIGNEYVIMNSCLMCRQACDYYYWIYVNEHVMDWIMLYWFCWTIMLWTFIIVELCQACCSSWFPCMSIAHAVDTYFCPHSRKGKVRWWKHKSPLDNASPIK